MLFLALSPPAKSLDHEGAKAANRPKAGSAKSASFALRAFVHFAAS
jgi:hypothetical protein